MTRRAAFFERLSWFKFNNLGLALGMNLKFYTSMAKELKLKVRKFWRLFSTFVEVPEEKLVRALFWPPYCPTLASWVRFKSNKNFRLADINSNISDFNNHISIKKIREYFPNIIYGGFDFTEFSLENVKKEMLNLNVKKSSTNVSIPATVLRQTAEIHLSFLTKSINKSYGYEKWSPKKKTLQGRRTTELIITRFTGFQKKNLQTNN